MSLLKFVESKINSYAKSILEAGDKLDQLSFGELEFYMSLRRVLKGTANPDDIGMIDAVNDTLQHLGIIQAGKAFYK